MPGKVPDRWEDYSAIGTPIEDTRIVAFKVPLEQSFCQKLTDINLSFTPLQLLDRLQGSGLHLGIIIDLTYTTRYYKRQEFEDRGVEYVKIFTGGHEVPKDEVQFQFMEIVDKYLQRTKGKDDLIGVHCTHGVNRTGYLICRYMVDRLGYSPHSAIAAFNKARGHSIERKNYLHDLQSSGKLHRFNLHQMNGFLPWQHNPSSWRQDESRSSSWQQDLPSWRNETRSWNGSREPRHYHDNRTGSWNDENLWQRSLGRNYPNSQGQHHEPWSVPERWDRNHRQRSREQQWGGNPSYSERNTAQSRNPRDEQWNGKRHYDVGVNRDQYHWNHFPEDRYYSKSPQHRYRQYQR